MFQLSNWSITRRLFAISGLALLCLVAVGTLALRGFAAARANLAEVTTSGQMLKNQVLADMLHDGIRGDVLSILVTDDPATRVELYQGLVDHTEELRAFVAENEELAHDIDAESARDLLKMLREVMPPLESYVSDARRIGEHAKDDPLAAKAELAEFEHSFVSLEEPMEAFADEILAYSSSAQLAADAGLEGSRRNALLGGALATALLFAFSLAVRASIARPLANILATVRAVASRDFTRKSTVQSQDEIGEIARATNTAIDAIQEAMGSIERTSRELTLSATKLNSISGEVCEDSRKTTKAAESATIESREVSAHVTSAATGVQELESTTQSIAQSVQQTSEVARNAVTVASTATDTVRKLGQSSQEIGGILRLINSIAEQTNLLALNATIEAASAGDAGRGFAVVANEVKALAQQTAKATDDIAHRVRALQSDSQGAVSAIASIAQIIDEMSTLTDSVSNSISAQSTTVSDIANRVTQAAHGTSSIVGEFQGVSQRTEQSLERLDGIASAADQLNSLARNLGDLVGRYQFQRAA